MNRTLHQAGILIGSNIDPEQNLLQAIHLLGENFHVLRNSSAWESRSVGFEGPNYLNAMVLIETPLDARELNQKVLRPLEKKLGRHRQSNKFAPRTIDLDIVTWNHKPVRDDLWQYAHAALPTSQLLPDLRLSQRKETLAQVAQRLAQKTWVRERADVLKSGQITV